MDQTKQLREDAAACDFVAAFLQDRERGVARPLAEYQACFPEFADRIATEHAALQSSATAPTTPPAIAGRDVGPYRLIERLGHGGQGVVFLAEHRDLQRTVALKMLHQGGLGLDSAQHARLRREAIALARLDHPGICSIYEVELDGPHPYLAMRHVPGASLAATIEQSRKSGGKDGLPPQTRIELDTWLSFFERAAQALYAAHLVGIVHRDIKPHNLMRTPSGEPVLLDFGLARDTASTSVALTQSHELFGTLSYMAPELLASAADPDPRADVYALGVTLYEVLTLQRPFAAATPDALRRQIESGDVTQARAHNPHLPRDVDIVLATALERDPARRYASALTFAEDLRRLRQREPILARPLSPAVRAQRWVRRHPLFSVAFALLATGLAVTLALLSAVERSNADLRASNRELSAVRKAHQARSLSEMDPGRALKDAVAAARDGQSPEIKDILLQVLDRCYEERLIELGREPTVPFAASALDEQGRWVAVPFQSGAVRVYSVADGTLVGTTALGPRGRTLAAFRPGTAQLLTAGDDGALRIWSVGATGVQPERTLSDSSAVGRPAGALAVSPDGRLAARCDDTGAVEIFDLSSDAAVVVCRGHTHSVTF
ncbi:MAG: serine/threonine-protein kinase, partial [Planctomycetota bacterium]